MIAVFPAPGAPVMDEPFHGVFLLRELCPEWEIRSEKSSELAQDQFGISRSICSYGLLQFLFVVWLSRP